MAANRNTVIPRLGYFRWPSDWPKVDHVEETAHAASAGPALPVETRHPHINITTPCLRNPQGPPPFLATGAHAATRACFKDWSCSIKLANSPSPRGRWVHFGSACTPSVAVVWEAATLCCRKGQSHPSRTGQCNWGTTPTLHINSIPQSFIRTCLVLYLWTSPWMHFILKTCVYQGPFEFPFYFHPHRKLLWPPALPYLDLKEQSICGQSCWKCPAWPQVKQRDTCP